MSKLEAMNLKLSMKRNSHLTVISLFSVQNLSTTTSLLKDMYFSSIGMHFIFTEELKEKSKALNWSGIEFPVAANVC